MPLDPKDLKSAAPVVKRATWQEVLVEQPPHQERWVEVERRQDNRIRMPEVRMHCTTCDADMLFESPSSPWPGGTTEPSREWVLYTCKHCESEYKLFALVFMQHVVGQGARTHVVKVGELPPYGPHVPARVITLIGPEREQFLKGRRAEAQGFGIGAFGYYRRVVESQRDRLLERIIKAAERTNAPAERIEALRMARAETRFTESMALAGDALPESLFIEGHNPLKLLHAALSKGLHELTDEECLDHAVAVREVLTALAERLAEVTRDHATLTDALNKLAARGGGSAAGPKAGA